MKGILIDKDESYLNVAKEIVYENPKLTRFTIDKAEVETLKRKEIENRIKQIQDEIKEGEDFIKKIDEKAEPEKKKSLEDRVRELHTMEQNMRLELQKLPNTELNK